MRITQQKRRDWSKSPAVKIARHMISQGNKWRYVFVAVFLIVFALSFIYYGIELHRTNQDWTARRTLAHAIRSNIAIPLHYVRGLLAATEVLEISLKQIHYSELAYHRAQAWDRGKITEREKSNYVPAQIAHGSKMVKAKVRLKGLFLDNLHPGKWSLRVRVARGQSILGTRRFSLQAPHTRNFIHEGLYHQALKASGLIGLEYKFVKVRMNGKNLGIFAFEEHFEETLSVRSGRPAGLFVKPFNSGLFIYRESALKKNREVRNAVEAFRREYQLFLDGELRASELFDVQRTGRYFAITDLFSGQHGNILGNFVCYYNPATGKLEPVGYDANAGFGETGEFAPLVLPSTDRFYARLFEDSEIVESYANELMAIGNDWLPKFLESMEVWIEQNLDILYREHPEFYLDLSYLSKNQKAIQELLTRDGFLLQPTYRLVENGEIVVRTGAAGNALGVQILGIWSGTQRIAKPEDGVLLTGRQERVTTRMRMIDPDPEPLNGTADEGFKLRYRPLGTEVEKEVYMALASNADKAFALVVRPSVEKLRSLPFVKVDEAANLIAVKPGRHELDHILVVPRNYELQMGAGTELDFVNSAMIFSRGPISLTGDPDAPVVITSSDGTGQGLAIIEADGQSQLRHVVIERQKSAKIGAWRPRGAVLFYESSVTLDSTVIRDMIAEDCLNVVRSTVEIRGSAFFRCASDALDLDFSRGEISDTAFLQSGNDALDLSGSEVTLSSVVINQAGDKALSVGENSRVTAKELRIANATIGVASKDGSEVTIYDSEIADSVYCLAAYQKKPEFGFGSIVAERVALSNCQTPYAVESGAMLKHDNRMVSPTISDARELVYAK